MGDLLHIESFAYLPISALCSSSIDQRGYGSLSSVWNVASNSLDFQFYRGCNNQFTWASGNFAQVQINSILRLTSVCTLEFVSGIPRHHGLGALPELFGRFAGASWRPRN